MQLLSNKRRYRSRNWAYQWIFVWQPARKSSFHLHAFCSSFRQCQNSVQADSGTIPASSCLENGALLTSPPWVQAWLQQVFSLKPYFCLQQDLISTLCLSWVSRLTFIICACRGFTASTLWLQGWKQLVGRSQDIAIGRRRHIWSTRFSYVWSLYSFQIRVQQEGDGQSPSSSVDMLARRVNNARFEHALCHRWGGSQRHAHGSCTRCPDKLVAWWHGSAGCPSSFLFLVAMPGAPSRILAPSSKARNPCSWSLNFSADNLTSPRTGKPKK